jgi:hypothetical protein
MSVVREASDRRADVGRVCRHRRQVTWRRFAVIRGAATPTLIPHRVSLEWLSNT